MAQQHRSTQRALDILSLLALCGDTKGYTLTEIATALNVPKSSVSPIIHTLEANHYLTYSSPEAKYSIGRKAFEVGSAYVKNDIFIHRRFPSCRALWIRVLKPVTWVSSRG